MRKCSYCGRENDDLLVACRECGTELSPSEPVPHSADLTRRTLVILGLIVLVASGVAVVSMPTLIFVVPLFALFHLPIYLPLLLSFLIKGQEWRGMRWSLRVASVAAFVIRENGLSDRPDFGNDVAGNIAGASLNFAWTWGSGAGCGIAAVIVGLLLRAVLPSRPLRCNS